RLASMIQYVSRTVITAYVTAAAVLIIANQCHHILGFRFEDGEAPSTFLEVTWATIRSIGDASGPAIAMSALTAVLFLLLRGRFRKLPNVAITLALASLASVGFKKYGFDLQTLDAFSAGAGFFALPNFDAMGISSLGTICWTAGALALLCALEGISIGKSLAARAGERLNANQETFAIGAGNLACAFFSGMPASGSLTRSTVNTQSGARSQVAMLFTGLIVLAGAFFLGQLVSYVPLPALATLVVFIGASLIRTKQIRAVARATRSDGIAFTVTLVFGLLLSLQIAIFAGVTTSILLFLRKVSEPELVEYGYTQEGHLAAISDNAKRPEPEVSIVHVEGELFFAAAELFYEQIRRVGEDRNLRVLVLKLRNAHHLDATSVLALEELLDYLKEKNCHVLLCEIRKDILRIFRNSGLLPRLNRKNLFIDSPSNPTLSIAKAIRRAKELVKGEKAQVTIYAEQMKHSERPEKES
ncbi:MAG: SulP family inorganic anion transporter, partial [Opitutae bacterium]|nr:SulP family inorganic anion transporter [Opitutae bacterium]